MQLPSPRPGPTGSAAAGVRPAAPEDAGELARVQVVTWRTAYRALLPATVLDDWDDAAASDAWRAGVATPPTPGHRVLVAEEAGRLVGFAAFGPADPTSGGRPSPDGPTTELSTLLVEPRWGRRGHGSRLLAAVADVACADGATRLQCWLAEADAVTARFLESAGWGRDGWVRSLDTGTSTIREARWHALLEPSPMSEEGAAP